MDYNRILPRVAARLAKLAAKRRLLSSDLESICPWLHRQILDDKEHPPLLSLWGLSVNHDENAGVTIVNPAILRAIGETAGIPMTETVVHAGLQHTYGYLLSTIATPFGYKRDRWVSPEIELGFGMKPDTLGPNPPEGTLLANATWIAGRIAFRGDESSTRKLRRISPAVADDVRRVRFERLPQMRIVESVAVRGTRGRFRGVRLRTDLVGFPSRVAGCQEDILLVYSVEDSSCPTAQLVTMFAVTEEFVEGMTRPQGLGSGVSVKARFNAFVPGISGEVVRGRRTLQRLE
jgi:hypothetical protein